MSCDQPLEGIHAALDGELPVADELETETHVRSCPACAAEYRRALTLRAALREGGLAATPPTELENRIRTSLRSVRPERRHPILRDTLALAAALLVGVALGRLVLPGGSLRSRGADDALVESHVRSLGAGPLTQVASSDQHTVKPWFAGKLDFSPKVTDLAADGFPLEGGRVDRVAGRPAAALVYRRGNHIVDLYVWLAEAPASRTATTAEVRGFHIVKWSEGDLAYAAISDLNEQELLVFANLVRR